MSAQVTEAHRALTRLGCARFTSLDEAAQLIADSEAKACAELRAEVERLTAACDKYSNDEITQGDWKSRAERAEADADSTRERALTLANSLDEAQAELAAERARLDWLMAGGVCMVQHAGGFHVSRLHAPVSRAHIDAAIKEETK